MDRLREWESAERAAATTERLAANLDGVDPSLGTVRYAREKARSLREKADELMAAIVQELGDRSLPGADAAPRPGDATS